MENIRLWVKNRGVSLTDMSKVVGTSLSMLNSKVDGKFNWFFNEFEYLNRKTGITQELFSKLIGGSNLFEVFIAYEVYNDTLTVNDLNLYYTIPNDLNMYERFIISRDEFIKNEISFKSKIQLGKSYPFKNTHLTTREGFGISFTILSP